MPKTFKDTKGREWCLEIDWPACQRIKDLTGITLDDLVPKRETKDPNALSALQDLIWDGFLMLDVCWAVLKPECDQKGITKEQFCEGWGGPTFEAAPVAFLEGLRDFFPSPPRKMILKQILTKGKATMERVMAAAEKRADAAMEKKLNELLSEPGSSGSTTTPALPALSPVAT